MHRIRKQARRHAWYGDGETTNLNPFGKHGIRLTNSHTDNDDLEAGNRRMIQRATSESNYRSAAEERRQSSFHPGNRSLSDKEPVASGAQAPRASTGAYREPALPPLSSSSDSPRSPVFGRSDSDKENNALTSSTANNSESTETEGISHATDSQLIGTKESTTLEPIDTNTQEIRPDGPRKRKLGGILGKLHRHKSDDDDGGDLEHTDTSASKPKKKENFTAWSQIQNTLLNSPINILLVAVPVGIALDYARSDLDTVIFAVNFVAIVPLAALLSYATEEIALRVGETLGGLLNASFGNATELIVSIIALFDGQIVITQTSLIGSMLSNLLLVMGMCFFFGGLTRVRQHFNITVAQTAASLLALALAGLIVPTVFDLQTTNSISVDITSISRGVSVILLVVYGSYLFFQLKTHSEIYNAPSKKVPKRHMGKGEANKGVASIGNMFTGMAPGEARENMMEEKDDEEEEEPKLYAWVAVATLVICTVLIAFCSEAMVGHLQQMAEESGISYTFVGLILLPIVGNAAEHATAVTVACKDKMDLAIGVAVGSSMQIALLVLPLVVIIGWIGGIDAMNLDFDIFQVVVLFISILLVNYLIADGESHWLEGLQLMILYIIIALASWYYPKPCTSAAEYCPSTGAN